MSTAISSVYPNNLKNWEFDKEAPQNFCSERATIAERQGASENENYEVKLTRSKTNFSSCLGIATLPSAAYNPSTILGRLHIVAARPAPLVLSPQGSDHTYEILGLLGSGGSSEVWEVLTPKKVERAAMKIHKPGKDFWTQSLQEVQMLRSLQEAPHALRYRDDFDLTPVCYEDVDRDLCICRHKSGDKHRHAIVTDLLPCSNAFKMFIEPNLYNRTTRVTTAQILSIGRQGLETLQYLRSQDLIHRDLKPENMAYNESTKTLVIFDFGSIEKVDRVNPQRFVGTLAYRAPEQILFKPYDTAVDVWSLAATLFELYTGVLLILAGESETEDQTITDQLHSLMQNFGAFSLEFIQSTPSDQQHFFNADRSIANSASDTATEDILRFAKIAQDYPGIPIWEARIRKAASWKRESSADVERLLAFLRPMLCCEHRITPDAALERVLAMGVESLSL